MEKYRNAASVALGIIASAGDVLIVALNLDLRLEATIIVLFFVSIVAGYLSAHAFLFLFGVFISAVGTMFFIKTGHMPAIFVYAFHLIFFLGTGALGFFLGWLLPYGVRRLKHRKENRME